VTARARPGKAPALRIKRAYEAPAASDGRRILVDRLWPRGLTKARARIDYWARAIAPSDALRKWYAHDAGKWQEFKRRYFAELDANAEGLEVLREHLGVDSTLVFGSREEKLNNAVALSEYLATSRRAKPRASRGAPRGAASSRSHSSARPKARLGIRWEQVRELALSYPGVREGTSYGQPAFLLDGKFFSRFNAKEQALVVLAEERLRDALLAGKPDVYFTTDHYRNYPAVLARLPLLEFSELAALYEARFRATAKKKRVAELDARAGGR
jgi:uncharacterized protein YeaO (DUF488 family)